MSRLYAILLLFVVAVIGIITVQVKRRNISQRIDDSGAYFKCLQDYARSQGKDMAKYTWLVEQSDKMQLELGINGIISYKPPAASYFMNDYPVIINLLPELHREFNDRIFPDDGLTNNLSLMLQETLLRHIGSLKELNKEVDGQLKNPLIWLREGVKYILLIPLTILQWFGVISGNFILKVSNNALVRLISGLIALLGFISSIITIVIGWPQVISYWHSLFGN
jgi:hypothetical protein